MFIRWFCDLARRQDSQVWGVDINGPRIAWCQQHLSPPFRFATSTSFPHLPFEDRFFDVIYGLSVFTHISDLAEAWLLELKRVLRPGGRLYLTVHDRYSIDVLIKENHPVAPMLRTLSSQSFSMFTINRTPGVGAEGEAQVFYDIDYLRRHWGHYLKVVSITPQAYGYQAAVLLEK